MFQNVRVKLPDSLFSNRVFPARPVRRRTISLRKLLVMAEWTFLTNHAHTLICIARDPGIRLRDVAERVGVTERAAQRIVSDLVDAGYLDRLREGRRNSYRIRADRPMRHPVEHGHRVGEILEVLHEQDGVSAKR